MSLRFLCLPTLLLSIAVLVSACDGFESGTPPSKTTENQKTTVQFTSPGASVAESDTARMTVELTTPTSLTSKLSVEVLLAEQAGSANRLDLVGAFPRNASNRELTRSVTFPAGTESGATRTVEFTELNDSLATDSEDALGEKEQVLETAIFKLQQLKYGGGNAVIGELDRFDLLVGLLDIAGARKQGAAGKFIATQGIVTRVKGDFTRIQDETGGLVIRQTSGDYFQAVKNDKIRPGDKILVTGNTSFFAGLQQVNEDDLSNYEIVSRNNPLPKPQKVTVQQVINNGEEYESELIRIEGLTASDTTGTFSAETNYDVSDGTGTIVLRPPSTGDTDIVGKPIPNGEFVYRGILGQFNGNFDSDEPDTGYQLQPINRDDVFVPEK